MNILFKEHNLPTSPQYIYLILVILKSPFYIFQEGAYRDRYSFICEWYDNQASMTRQFNIFYYPTDDTLEMFDLKTRKTFVRRVKVNGVTLDNFFIGSTIYILGRMIKIVNYACEDTKKKLYKDVEL